jgi:hypothetical protein
MSIDQLSSFYRLPGGFQELALLGMLTMETIDIILQIQKMRKGRSYQTGYPHRSFSEGATQDHKYDNLLEACPGLNIPDGPEGPALERLLCTLLMKLCIDKTHRYGYPGSMYQGVVVKLHKLLPLATPPSEGPGRSCLLWISLMMTDSWPKQSEQTAMWLHQVRCWFPEIGSWEVADIEQFGKRYIWTVEIGKLVAKHWPTVQDDGDESS